MADVNELADRLQATLGKLDVALSGIVDAIVWTNEAGQIQWCNTRFQELIGRRRLELLGMPLMQVLPLERPEGGPVPAQEHPMQRLLRGEASGDYDLAVGGRRRFVEVIGKRAEVPGHQTSAVVVIRDVTERRRLEEERRQAQAEVAAKNRELETLLYVVSHDLREPLRAIESFSTLVSDQYAAGLDDKGQDFLRRVVRASSRMQALLEDVLTLSRARHAAPPAEPLDAQRCAQEVLERLASKLAQTGAAVRVDEDLPRLRADRTWATQALYNLTLNALKFTREGQRPELEIAGYRDGRDVGLVVRDRGPGVAPEHAERIFELFQRAVGREIEGTGAGLAIVRAIAERHGGRAWVQARDGGGSEFVVTFGPGWESQEEPDGHGRGSPSNHHPACRG
jgi:PAS domain S-box-containing protein